MRNVIFGLKLFFITLITITLFACGGSGGGTSPVQTTTTAAVTPSATPAASQEILKTVSMAFGVEPWFHSQQINADGSETLMLSTIDAQNFRTQLTPATQFVAINATNSGVQDVSSSTFDTIPNAYAARNINVFTADDGAKSMWICSQGRETSSPTSANGVNGIWGEQDQLFVMRNGKYVNESFRLPQGIDFTHGCAVTMINGKVALIKNALSGSPVYKSILMFDGNNYSTAYNLDEAYQGNGQKGSFAVAAADLIKSGNNDIIVNDAVIRMVDGKFKTVYNLKGPQSYIDAGYTIVHNLVVGDVNGDGYPDLIVTYSGNGEVANGPAFLSGAKLAVFINDQKGNLVVNEAAIPSMNETEMGLTIRLFDVNFDGKLDIVTSGPRYMVSNLTNSDDDRVRTILISNGDGTFSKKEVNDQTLESQCNQKCQRQTYFLKNGDGSYNIVAYGMDSSMQRIMYTRKVTQAKPLTIQ